MSLKITLNRIDSMPPVARLDLIKACLLAFETYGTYSTKYQLVSLIDRITQNNNSHLALPWYLKNRSCKMHQVLTRAHDYICKANAEDREFVQKILPINQLFA